LNCFQILHEVLDEAYAEIDGTEQEKDNAIKRELERLSQKYLDLRTYAEIDYSRPVTRFAYVYAYVSSHANLVYQIIPRSSALTELFKEETISVTCVGGGPGSDLLGILKYLESRKRKTQLNCQTYDAVTAWGETWEGLFENVDT
jgi:hypothetical protein